MSHSMYSLALAVVDGKMSAEEAAPLIGELAEWTSASDYDSPKARAERFRDDLPTPDGDNSFARVTALYFAGKLTKNQYDTLKAGLSLSYESDA